MNNNEIEKTKEFIFSDFAKGGKTKVVLKNDRMIISRPGAMAKLSHGFTGEKTIFFNQITSVQLKEAGMSRGYIQFTLAGSAERKSGILKGDSTDENTIYFASNFNNKEVNNNARQIKEAIENYIANLHNSSTTIVKTDDKYDQLAKLKNLLDNNIITQEEFDNEKEKILNQ